MRLSGTKIAVVLTLMAAASVNNAQLAAASSPKELYSHGTCSTTILAPFGAAFIIDSRITQTDQNGTVVSQFEGCKALLGRPTILLAGVGLEDSSGVAGHWNSLDQAAEALKRLPENPSEEQLNQWGDEWAQSLWRHFRESGLLPRPGTALGSALRSLVKMLINPVPIWNTQVYVVNL
jgi:hypothetical protein